MGNGTRWQLMADGLGRESGVWCREGTVEDSKHSRGHANDREVTHLPRASCNALTAANLFGLFVGGNLFPLTARIAHLLSLH